MPTTPIRLVLTTCANPEEARRLARTLVEEQLAACVTIVPAIESIYRWQGKIESSAETFLLIKTGLDQLPALGIPASRAPLLRSSRVPRPRRRIRQSPLSRMAPVLSAPALTTSSAATRSSSVETRISDILGGKPFYDLVNDWVSRLARSAADCSRGRGPSHSCSA